MNTRTSNNNLDALIAYKNKLKEVKEKELVIFQFLNLSKSFKSNFNQK